MALKQLSSAKCFGGYSRRFSHASKVLNCDMIFSVFIPPLAQREKVSVLYWLSGLTCTDENFATKAGAHKYAAEHNLLLVIPDTSPRGPEVEKIEGVKDSWDFGIGAGFYVNATEPKFAKHFNMYSYITSELPTLIDANFSVNEKKSIFGHSMGGHGALICALKNPGLYKSVSAFSPICHPIGCPWGQKAFRGYLGESTEKWKEYDACELVKKYNGPKLNILIDQGTDDKFYKEKQLLPETFVEACKDVKGVETELRMQAEYDHSYYFISSYVEDHIKHHAQYLKK